MSAVIRVENVSKRYRLGVINRRMLYEDLQSRWARWRGLPDPNAPVLASSRRGNPDGHEEFWALRDVSFEVQEGKSLAIIGSNGAGKSTLLKILSEITSPTTGRVLMKGRVASLLEVGTGFQPELTGRENVYLNGAILGLTRRDVDARFDEIAAFSGVEEFLGTPVKRYSSGMCVRLAFAVAAHLEPEVLIIDEVLAVGDAAFQKKCIGKISQVSQAGRTVIFVSHNMLAVRRLCNSALIIKHGRLVSQGPVDAVVAEYLASTTDRPLSQVQLPSGSDRTAAQADLLEFLSPKGVLQANFHLGEPWRIKLHFTVRSAVHAFIAAVGVSTFDQVAVITFFSEAADLQPGKYEVVFDLRLPLQSGDYQFSVGLSSGATQTGSHETHYYCDSAGHVSVDEVAFDQEQPLRHSGTGLLWTTERAQITPAKP